MKKSLFTVIAFFSLTVLSAQTPTIEWTGGLAAQFGAVWNNAGNWDPQRVPLSTDVVEIGQTVTISGSAPNDVAGLRIRNGETVNLDLDLTVGNANTTSNAVRIDGGGTGLVLAENRTLTINPPAGQRGFTAFNGFSMTVSSGAVMDINGGQESIFIPSNAVNGTFINDGTLDISGQTQEGIFTQAGNSAEFVNNGDLTVIGGTVGVDFEGGTLTNNAQFTVEGTADDAMNLTSATVVNAGTMNLTTAGTDNSSADNALEIGAAGLPATFDNQADGVLTANGSSNSNPRAVSVATDGTLNNDGIITLSGGNTGRSLSNDGGDITNQKCGTIDLTDTRMNNNAGTFTNIGLLLSSHSGALLSNGTAINRGFYKFTNAAAPTWPGGGTNDDRGVNASAGTVNYDLAGTTTVDFNGTSSNFGIFEWAYDGNSLGTNNGDGTLDLSTASFPDQAGPHTLTVTNANCTNLNNEVTITVSNVGASALPVELSYFRAETSEKIVLLIWETTQELNNEYFTLERSADGHQFEVLTRVAGQGNTEQTTNYRFPDEQPLNGVSYYRLLQTDYDGTTIHQGLVSVRTNAIVETFVAFPTLLGDDRQLTVRVTVAQPLQLIDVNGRPQRQFPAANATEQRLDLSDLPSGLYFLRAVRTGTTLEIWIR